MQFDKDSSTIIKHIIPNIKKIGAYKSLQTNIKLKNSLENLILFLYDEIHQANLYVKKNISDKLNPTLSEKIITPSIYGGKYFPQVIKTYIETNLKYQLTYQQRFRNKTFKIIFGLMTDMDIQNIDKYNAHAEFVFTWLFICDKFSLQTCSETLSIYIYLTPQKKKLPTDSKTIISSPHVNTGVTYHCKTDNELIVYRKEEWKKVLIHETFHSFGFDFIDNNAKQIQEYVKTIFPVKSDFLICEAYTETWSRILNSAFSSYYSLANINDKENYILYTMFALQCERIFSIMQMMKILKFMNMEYSDLTNLDDIRCSALRKMYKEDSNVLSYYVITSLFMNDFHNFLLWCSSNNTNMFRFSTSTYNINSFIQFIKEQYENPELIKAIDQINLKYKDNKKFLSNTLRMTCVETKRNNKL